MLGPCKPNRPLLSKIAFDHGVHHGNREQTWSVCVNSGLANVCRGVGSTGGGPMGNPVPHCDLSHRTVFILLRRGSPGSLLTCDYQVIWVRIYGGLHLEASGCGPSLQCLPLRQCGTWQIFPNFLWPYRSSYGRNPR